MATGMPRTTNESVGAPLIAAVMLLAASVGCDGRPSLSSGDSPSTELQTTNAVSRGQIEPETLLRSVFQRYRNAIAYHDKGMVRLTYQVGKRFESATEG